MCAERQCVVFELFGKVRWVADEPGLHFPWMHMGPFAALVPFFGHRRFVDLRLDQTYLRSSRSTPKRARRWASASGTRCT